MLVDLQEIFSSMGGEESDGFWRDPAWNGEESAEMKNRQQEQTFRSANDPRYWNNRFEGSR